MASAWHWRIRCDRLEPDSGCVGGDGSQNRGCNLALRGAGAWAGIGVRASAEGAHELGSQGVAMIYQLVRRPLAICTLRLSCRGCLCSGDPLRLRI